MFETSAETDKLDAALAKAQGSIQTAKKDAINPHFQSAYADLASVFDACREALSAAGVSVSQWPIAGEPGKVTLVTRLAHAGQWMKGVLVMPVVQQTPQGLGSAITYAKRYALSAAVGVAADDDDDGNAASAGHPPRQDKKAPPPQQQRKRDTTMEVPQEAPPSLERALADINKTASLHALAAIRQLLAPMAWSAVERKTVGGALTARKKALESAKAPPAVKACEECGAADGHKAGCPLGPREPGSDG